MMNKSHTKQYVQDSKKLAENIDEWYLSISLHIDETASAWFVKKVAEMQHFRKHPRQNWVCDGELGT